MIIMMNMMYWSSLELSGLAQGSMHAQGCSCGELIMGSHPFILGSSCMLVERQSRRPGWNGFCLSGWNGSFCRLVGGTVVFYRPVGGTAVFYRPVGGTVVFFYRPVVGSCQMVAPSSNLCSRYISFAVRPCYSDLAWQVNVWCPCLKCMEYLSIDMVYHVTHSIRSASDSMLCQVC